MSSDENAESRWEVGHVLAAHGLRGGLKLRFRQLDPQLLAADRILVGESEYRVLEQRYLDPRTAVVTLDGVADRNGAEALIGAPLSIDLAWFSADEAPMVALIGADVLNLETGVSAGAVVDVYHNGAHWLLALGEEERLIPFVDAFIEGVDRDDRGRSTIRLRPIPGLLEPFETPASRA